jgi:hypothetical protein
VISILQRFENMGRKGGLPSLGVALLLIAVSGVSAYYGWLSDDNDSMIRILGPNFVALSAGAGAMVFTVLGMKLLTQVDYGDPEDLFPSLHRDDFLRALKNEQRPLCVCTRCRIHLPAQFSTGACPRCNSSVEYYEIATDEDANMARSGMP